MPFLFARFEQLRADAPKTDTVVDAQHISARFYLRAKKNNLIYFLYYTLFFYIVNTPYKYGTIMQ